MPDASDLGAPAIPDLRRPIVEDQSGEILARGVAGLGRDLTQASDVTYQAQTRYAAAKAANAGLDHQIAAQGAAQDISDRVQTGQLDYGEAQKAFETSLSQIKTPDIANLTPEARMAFSRQLERNTNTAQQLVRRTVHFAEVKDYASQGDAALDKLDKLRQMPGADVASINAQAADLMPLLRKGGRNDEQASKAIQDFQDNSWFLQAQQHAMEAKDSIGATRKLEEELTSGFYVGKLDTPKRDAVLRSAINNRLALENRAEHEEQKREAAGLRALYQMDTQVSTGVPATPDMWTSWRATLKGTSFEGEFEDRQKSESEIQQLLRQPIEKQLAEVQARSATLESGGGSVRDIANLSRLSRAVDQNVKTLQTAPLVFNAQRTGQQVTPIDPSALIQGDPHVAAQFSDRMTTLQAMTKQYGTEVLKKPLLPEEAQALGATLDRQPPEVKAQAFGALRTAIGDDATFRAAMQQIAPGSPVTAYAGLLSTIERPLTIATHFFAKDDSVDGKGVAATMLRGQAILTPTGSDKKEDGQRRIGLLLPGDADAQLQAQFTDEVGNAFAYRGQLAEQAFQAMRAYYVGRADELGKVAADKHGVDSGLVRESVRAVLGHVVDYNNTNVIAPWGMDESAFLDKARTQLTELAKAHGYAPEQFGSIGLQNGRGSDEYYLTTPRGTVLDPKSGAPLTVTIR